MNAFFETRIHHKYSEVSNRYATIETPNFTSEKLEPLSNDYFDFIVTSIITTIEIGCGGNFSESEIEKAVLRKYETLKDMFYDLMIQKDSVCEIVLDENDLSENIIIRRDDTNGNMGNILIDHGSRSENLWISVRMIIRDK